MSNLYDILETCLQEIENGSDLDTVLSHHAEHADELRPILEASIDAKAMAVPAPSVDLIRRNRSKVLQHAAEMRERNVQPSRRLWAVPLRRAFATLVIVAVLFSTGTSLVRASSTTLPGDNLYPVKRTWEDVQLLLTFNAQSRETLEVEHENERLEELKELFANGRSIQVDFSGLVTRQNGDLWLVSGIEVSVTAQSELPAQPISVGDGIHVVGTTQKDGTVLAQMIELLPPGMPLPVVIDDDVFEGEQENSGPPTQSNDDNSGEGSEAETPEVDEEQTPESQESLQTGQQDQPLNGVVESINGNIIVINGQALNIRFAEIKGTPSVGVSAKVEGYYDAAGIFIVTKIEFQNGGSSSGSDSVDEGSDDNNDGSNDNDGNDDNNDSNDNDNTEEDNSNSGGWR